MPEGENAHQGFKNHCMLPTCILNLLYKTADNNKLKKRKEEKISLSQTIIEYLKI